MYELRSYGNQETGEAHYLVDGVEVSKAEYDRCLEEYLKAKSRKEIQA
jgi:transcription termination factor NusB